MPIKHMVLPKLATSRGPGRGRHVTDSLSPRTASLAWWAMVLGFLEKSPLAGRLAPSWSGLVFITSEPVLISTLSLGTKACLSGDTTQDGLREAGELQRRPFIDCLRLEVLFLPFLPRNHQCFKAWTYIKCTNAVGTK